MSIPATTGLTFDDEFKSFSSSPDGSTGTWDTTYLGGNRSLWGNNEAEYYSDSSVGQNPSSLANQVLTISATPVGSTPNSFNLPYDSGVITTQKSFSQTYGYFEINAELPSGQGMWPAFWLLPASGNYTSELDFFEMIHSNTTAMNSTLHGSTNGIWGSDFQSFNVANYSTGFHTYGVDWEKDITTFYDDGVAVGSAPTPTSMNDPMYMIANLAVGGAGSWPGATDASTVFPAQMQIRSIRAYATAGTTYVGGSASIPAGTIAPPVTTPPVTTPSVTPPPTAPAPITLGSGPDTLALTVSEDAYQGDAQFTVSIDGVQVDGTQTATALHSSNAPQVFNVQGKFGTAAHAVAANFLNDLYAGTTATDRNLYVAGATVDGVAVSNASLKLNAAGAQQFSFQIPPAPVMPPPVTPPSGLTILGVGADTLALSVTEDAYQGNAQFTVAVDGVQIGVTQSATGSNASNAPQIFDIKGNFRTVAHKVGVDFLSDLYGGTPSTDRNLYVTGSSIDGTTVANGNLNLMGSGTQEFSFQSAAAPLPPAPPVTATTDKLALEHIPRRLAGRRAIHDRHRRHANRRDACRNRLARGRRKPSRRT